jgi:hypothetical protein
VIEIVRQHIREGIRPVPIPYREKRPIITDWLSLVITEENLGQFFNGSPTNVGAILGTASGGLQDVDLDCNEALKLARTWLPPTRTFGRASNPTSHYLYRSPDLAREGTKGFDDPLAKLTGRKGKLLELRSNGGQTVLPGSTHKDTGEIIEWDNPSVPFAECSRAELERITAEIAAGCCILRYWNPAASGPLFGALRAIGWDRDHVERFISPIAGSITEWPASDPLAWIDALSLPRLTERAEEKETKTWRQARAAFGEKVRAWLGLPAPPKPARAPRSLRASGSKGDRVSRARLWLAQAEPAISGSGGSPLAFRIVERVVRGFDLNNDEALEALADWNSRCQPPWSTAAYAPDSDSLPRLIDRGRERGDTPTGELLNAPMPERAGWVHHDATAGDATASATNAGATNAGSDELPTIKMTVMLADVTDTVVARLATDTGIYQRDGTLVHVVRAEPEDDKSRVREGTPQVHTMMIPTLRERLTRVAKYLKQDARNMKWSPSIPSDQLTQAVFCRREWKGIRELAGVLEAPSMRPDGTVIDTPGYDVATRFLYSPPYEYPKVPQSPTQEDAANALVDLREVFIDFPIPSLAGRVVPIAALLTILGRPAIRGAVPAFLFDAPTPGTGKSLCADAVCMIATGRPAPRGTFPHNEEELEKVLGSYALKGQLVVGFDNISPQRGFGGAPLDKCLTAVDTVDFRVLGRSEMPTVLWRGVVLGSGNNIRVIDDTVRRSFIARIISTLENPEERDTSKLKHHPLLPWVSQERRRLVVAALTMLRAFVVAGRPRMDGYKPPGSFEAWGDLVVQSILFAGGCNVLEARPGAAAGTGGERGAIVQLLSGWKTMQTKTGTSDGVTTREAITYLFPPPSYPPVASPEGYEAMREAIETLTSSTSERPNPKKLGEYLNRLKDRPFDNKLLKRSQDRTKIARWFVDTVNE